MKNEYVYVSKTYRNKDISSKEYARLSDYLRTMWDDHGLAHDPLAPFIIPREYHCFRVIDKAKAFTFCMKNGEHIRKPDK